MRTLVICLVLPAMLALTSCGPGDGAARGGRGSEVPAEPKPNDGIVLGPGSLLLKQIRMAQVEVRDTPSDEVRSPGKVELDPNRVSHLLMPVPGRVREVLVKLGDTVTEGQTLLVIESPEATAAAAAQSQALAVLRQGTSTQAKAERDLSRIRDLYEHKASALKDVSNAENDLVQAQAAVEQAQAEVEQARHRLELLGLRAGGNPRELPVRAPIRGKVLEIGVAPGEYRNDTSASLMTIADLSTVWITSNVPESQIRLIQTGERVEVELSAYPGELIRGTVKRIADTVDPESRTIKVQAEMPNPDGRFRPEMFGSIYHAHGLRPAPVVPARAVVQAEGGAYVYVEKAAGTFERRRIVAGDARDGLVPVVEGLRRGERVVVDGAVLLMGK